MVNPVYLAMAENDDVDHVRVSEDNPLPVTNASGNTVNNVSYVSIVEGGRVAAIDDNTNSLQFVDYEHHEIHGGSAYRAGSQETPNAAGTLSLTWTTPNNGKQMHMVFSVETANSSEVTIYEDVSFTSNGTAITPRNANRNSADASSVQTVEKDATVNVVGATILGHKHIGAVGVKQNDPSFGGATEARHEWVLKEDTTYHIEVEDVSGESHDMWIGLDWYEHTPKTS